MSERIRNVLLSDAAQIASIYKYYVDHTTITFELDAPSEDEIAHRIMEYTKTYPWIVMEIDGVVIGYAYASKFRERIAYRFTAEVSVYLSSEHQGEGYGKTLAKCLLESMTTYGFYIAIAGITATNLTSIHFFETLGFESCAMFPNVGYKNGEWLSVAMLSKNLQSDFPGQPEETKAGQRKS